MSVTDEKGRTTGATNSSSRVSVCLTLYQDVFNDI
jgi:hypothetical protein